MTRSLSRLQALFLGLTLLVGLAIAGWSVMSFGQRKGWSADSVAVQAAFQDVAGLQVGTRVHLQGVDVGEVADVALPEVAGQPVQVHLRLAGHVSSRLGTDARVKIARDNPLSDRIVRLLPGAPDAPRLHDGATLAPAEAPDLFDGLAQATTRLNGVLVELEGAVRELRKGENTLTRDGGQAVQRLNAVLGKVDQTLARVNAGEGTLGKLVQDDKLYDELTSTLQELKAVAYEVRRGDGTLGRLVQDKAAYEQAVQAVQDVRALATSVKQNSDAVKSLPVVRSYVVDTHRELVRPDRKRLRKVYAEDELFEPGRAVLTTEGRKKLDTAAEWLKTHPAGEVVVASLTTPVTNATFAQTLTQKQSEAVRDQLVKNAVHRTGWWWWNTRTVRALGCGNQAPAQPETEDLPPARVEVILFLPEG